MNWSFDNDRPIYKQLVEQLEIAIITGIYKSGDKLPSVRDLALETKVNPNTMQKALQALETLGLVNTQRTSGRYITNDQSLLDAVKQDMAQQNVHSFLLGMRKLGITEEEAIAYIKREEDHK